MSFGADKAKKRILGRMLPQFMGQSVCLLGSLVQLEPSGKVLKMKTSDDQLISVQLQMPITDPIDRILEVQGTVSSNNTIQCVKCIPFDEDMTKNFDAAMYNEAIEIMSKNPERYITAN